MPSTAPSVSLILLIMLTITPAFMVVTSRNIVHAAVYLGLTFVGVAGLYFLLNAPFLGAAQVLIYVGAITVLIMFALMMTAQRLIREPRNALPNRVLAAVTALVLFGILGVWVPSQPVMAAGEAAPVGPNEYLDKLAEALLGKYLLPFEIASVLLLAALVGAIVLAKEEKAS